jgi:RNA polymerase sigma factor for flagellar operon FliA
MTDIYLSGGGVENAPPPLSYWEAVGPAVIERGETVLRARELLTANLAVIERAVAFACRRYRLGRDDCEELGAVVRLKLVESDYAILRAFGGRCSLATYLRIVVQRMALDYRIHVWGKWHASAEAKRLGKLAVELETLLYRDGRTLDEALPLLAAAHEGVTRQSLEALDARLPRRGPRRREIALDAVEPLLDARTHATEDPLLAHERRTRSRQLSEIMSSLIGEMPEDDRLMLQLRFEGGMTIAQISRALQVDQRMLYRRVDRCLRDLRSRLEVRGVAPEEVFDLVESSDSELFFQLGPPAPTMGSEELS